MHARTKRPRKPVEELRRLSIGVRLNQAEWESIHHTAQLLGIAPTTWLRVAALGKAAPRPQVPELNRRAYGELARLAGNLNQMLKLAHSGHLLNAENINLRDLRRIVQCLRLELLGIKNDSQVD